MDLFIIRHAWAAERDDAAYPDDSLRPLTDEGRNRFARHGRGPGPPRAGAAVDRHQPHAALPANGRDPCRGPWRENQGCASGKNCCPAAIPSICWPGRKSTLPAWSEVAWVGHAPDVGYLAAVLIGLDDGWLDLKKGAIAAIGFPDRPNLAAGNSSGW